MYVGIIVLVEEYYWRIGFTERVKKSILRGCNGRHSCLPFLFHKLDFCCASMDGFHSAEYLFDGHYKHERNLRQICLRVQRLSSRQVGYFHWGDY